MMVLVSYDVSTRTPRGKARLRKVARACGDFGQRVQYSVFECEVDPVQWEELRHRLLALYTPEEDSLRFYYLGSSWRGRVEHHGTRPATDFSGPLIA
jgi:CRISPR-associated protein Cas2